MVSPSTAYLEVHGKYPTMSLSKSKQCLESEMLWGSIWLLGTLLALVLLAEIFWLDRWLFWWWNLGLADL
jgi:hypothetical protein